MRLALGLGAGSVGMLGAGLVGLWRPGTCEAGALALAAWGWFCPAPGRRAEVSAPQPALFPGWVTAAAAALAVVSLAANFLGALTPETGYDSLIQHLADARDARAEGRVFFNDLTFLAQHPAAVEMLYAWFMPWLPAAGGDTAAKLLHAFFGVATAWAFRAWALGRVRPPDATLLACALYLTPFNGILSARAYVDLGLAFWSAAALAAPWGSWAQGALLGCAVGTKYLGGYLLIGWMIALAAGRRAGWLRVGIAASLVAGWWGIRNWLNTGNPVYPFAWNILGGIAWGGRSASEYAAELSSYGRVEGLSARLAIPWLATVHDKGALDDGSLGPLFLAGIPLLLVAAGGRDRVLRWFLAAAWGLWLVSPRQVRYALMLLPPTLAALLPGMRAAATAWPRGWKVSSVMMPLVLLVNLEISFAAIYLWTNPVYVALGMESRGEYLARVVEPRDPGTGRSMYMPVAGWVQGHAGPGARTYMLGDAKVYFLPGRWRVNALFNPPLLARVVRDSGTAREAAKRLRQRGITHVLYNVGGSIHIEYTHHLFAWTPREFGLVEDLFRSELRPLGRQDTTEGDPMYLLFRMESGRWPDPPYLPGVDTRIAGVEEARIRRLDPDAGTLAARLLADFPGSRYLRFRLAPFLRGGHR